MPPFQNQNFRRGGPVLKDNRNSGRTKSTIPERNQKISEFYKVLDDSIPPGDLSSTKYSLSGESANLQSHSTQPTSNVGKIPSEVQQPSISQPINVPSTRKVTFDCNANNETTRNQPQPSNDQNQSLQTNMIAQSNQVASDQQTFRERLWEATKTGKFADVILVVENLEYPVSKMVVSVESEYFARLFNTDLKATRFTISDTSPPIMLAILEFIYRGHLDDYSKLGTALREAAETFELPNLVAFCSDVVVNKRNIVKEIVESVNTQNLKWQDEIIAYIREHPTEVQEMSNSDELSQLKQTDPKMAQLVIQVLSTN